MDKNLRAWLEKQIKNLDRKKEAAEDITDKIRIGSRRRAFAETIHFINTRTPQTEE